MEEMDLIKSALCSLASERTARRFSGEVFTGVPKLFMRSALALLKRSDLVAAICGDKSSLGAESAYYRAFYEFAKLQPDLAVVRLFGDWCLKQNTATAHCNEHNRHPNVMGIWVRDQPENVGNLMAPMGFGLVLFKSSQVVTALLHWGDSTESFQWTATSDPIVTTVLLDTWGVLSLLHKDKQEDGRLEAFRRRFGIVSDE